MYKKILVPVDGSATSLRGLGEAIKLAKTLKADVRLVHVVDEFVGDTPLGPVAYYDKWIEALREGGKKTLADAAAFARKQGIEPDALMLETVGARAADMILDEAKKWPADLIVIGTHGRRGVRRLLMGSDAELILRGATVPVLLLRDSEAEE